MRVYEKNSTSTFGLFIKTSLSKVHIVQCGEVACCASAAASARPVSTFHVNPLPPHLFRASQHPLVEESSTQRVSRMRRT
jgi:hypothetical protein